MTVLAIETSCDETAVAILRGRQLIANEVASQISEHAKFGGVVPEVAARNHLVQLPRLLERALASAKIEMTDVDAFAATSGPGLASSLLVGNSAAKGLAIGARKPFLAINHLEGHLLSPFVASASSRCDHEQKVAIPSHVALIVSGGHTLLVRVRGLGDYEILGRTLDDAAGEAFDKVAKLLGLGYPGGPEIEKRAANGNPGRFDLPRSMLDSGDLNFSFSGLKTAVKYLLADLSRENGSGHTVIPSGAEGSRHGTFKASPQDPSAPLGMTAGGRSLDLVRDDVCAAFQQAVIDVLREKSLRALKETKSRCLTLSGGVSCNRALRENLRGACEKNKIEFLVAEPCLSTDNAAMIAFAARLRLEAGNASELAEEIDPNLALV